MLGMALNSAKLFLAGKLFQDLGKVIRQMLVAIVIGVAVVYGVSLVAPVWVAAIAGGAVSGFLQPILFKDLKYA
ncbi:hypothetical protein U879_13170 [Defluviimonas sp. 20V17]|jgi:hypothetical protein|uniref:Uncharacterized protein n=1 Tax=Allgaiera indica TaxID=765699 RepID=A0AAN4ZZY4_9RHOB|nr:hypothetical protein [Allgaiera indica]KDB03201.1 hypothetical protein U879_13170 [Defluviimonas sp. 20V17]GHE01080.1 hypothetical protein GCM10008024_15300 [Allgaiera indica]SDW77738.1 hypothetical protein SAMN05444006_106219 [Allgaiera indica]